MVVVMMLFSISVASATGYLIVTSEFGMAKHSSDGAEALAVARAGLERFIAESIGVVDDTVQYALGDGIAVVTSRKIFSADSVTDYYHVRAEGSVADVFAPSSPARRVVAATAIHRRRPLPHNAAAMIATDQITASNGAEIKGVDHNVSTDCPGGGADQITGAIARVSVSEQYSTDIMGSPQWDIWSGGHPDMLDAARVRWDVLSDPDFPVEFENVWPNFAALPADSFPVVRYTGTFTSGDTGRGVLIVDGTFDVPSSFRWHGIVLAAGIDDYIEGDVYGLLVAGLDGPNFYTTVNFMGGDQLYYSCYVYAANESLSYLELVENTVHEVN